MCSGRGNSSLFNRRFQPRPPLADGPACQLQPGRVHDGLRTSGAAGPPEGGKWENGRGSFRLPWSIDRDVRQRFVVTCEGISP